MFKTENSERRFKTIQYTDSRKQEVQIQRLSLAYMIIGVAALAGFVFLIVTDSDMFYALCDYVFNPGTADPASVILWASGGWFLALLTFVAAVLAAAMLAAYWVIGIAVSILLRRKLRKGTDYRKTGINFGVWASILIVPLISDVISRLKSFFNNLSADVDIMPKGVFNNLDIAGTVTFIASYIMMIASAAIGISVLVIIYRDRKSIGADAQSGMKETTSGADMC